VRPDERGELYFVATGLGDGSHKFSKTHGEHERAVAEFLGRLRHPNRGR
jgi:cell division protein YceG involved in septum cleavage